MAFVRYNWSDYLYHFFPNNQNSKNSSFFSNRSWTCSYNWSYFITFHTYNTFFNSFSGKSFFLLKKFFEILKSFFFKKKGILGHADTIIPWKIIVIFFSLGYICISWDLTGIFEYISLKTLAGAVRI